MPHRVVLVVPLLLNVAAKAHFHRTFGHPLKPYASAGQPGIRQLGLPAVHQLLAEQAIFIPQGITHGRIALSGQTVHEAGCQAAQAAVAQTGVGLLLVEVIQLNIVFCQGLAEVFLQAQVEQGVTQGASQKELHAEVVDLLSGRLFGVLHKLGPAFGHQLPHDEDACLVIFLVGGVFQGDAKSMGQLVTNGLFNLGHAHRIIHVMIPPNVYCA